MFLPKTLIQWVVVIGLVADYTFRCFLNESTLDGGFNKLYFYITIPEYVPNY